MGLLDSLLGPDVVPRPVAENHSRLEAMVRVKQSELQGAPLPAGTSWPLSSHKIDFETAYTTADTWISAGALEGEKLYYKRSGSHPGGILDLDMGGEILSVAPGTEITIPFKSLSYRVNKASIKHGKAVLVALSNVNSSIVEPAYVAPPAMAYIGTMSAIVDAVPTTATTGLRVDGWRILRVHITNVTGGARSVNITPWFITHHASLNQTVILNAGMDVIAMPAPASGDHRRTFEMELAPWNSVARGAQSETILNTGVKLVFQWSGALPDGDSVQMVVDVFGVE